MTLTEFLEARIAEDEAPAMRAIEMERFAVDGSNVSWDWHRHEVTQNGGEASSFRHGAPSPARVLAECEAKRRIVRGMQPFSELDDINADEVFRILATVYADHPDFQPEWRL